MCFQTPSMYILRIKEMYVNKGVNIAPSSHTCDKNTFYMQLIVHTLYSIKVNITKLRGECK
jgi:hypothetical protein